MSWQVVHEMQLVDGVWTCPECGRRVQMEPLKVLDKGDQSVRHYGATGGIVLKGIEVTA